MEEESKVHLKSKYSPKSTPDYPLEWVNNDKIRHYKANEEWDLIYVANERIMKSSEMSLISKYLEMQ